MILSIVCVVVFFQKEKTTVCLYSDPDVFVNNTFVFGASFQLSYFYSTKVRQMASTTVLDR